jgi:lysophospholipase L1-like esterase
MRCGGIGTLLIDLTKNSNLVQVNSIGAISTDVVYIQSYSPAISVISGYRLDRVRQNGNIERIDLANLITLNHLTNFYICLWRYNGATFDRIGYQNIFSLLSIGLNSVTLPTPISAIEGDFIGYTLSSDGTNTDTMSATAQASGSLYKLDGVATPYDWNANGTPLAYISRSHLYAQAPLLVGIGDSLMESYPLHYSYVDGANVTDAKEKTWLYKLQTLDARINYQNLGVGNEQSDDILTRFSQVTNAKPKICIINCGTNDIFYGMTKVAFMANLTSMLDLCAANNIIPIMWAIPPCNNLNNTNMQTRDNWNPSIKTLVESYTNGIYVEWDVLLGINRVGGDAGNLWDINPTYADGDGTHFNEAGNQVLADEIYRILTSVTV